MCDNENEINQLLKANAEQHQHNTAITVYPFIFLILLHLSHIETIYSKCFALAKAITAVVKTHLQFSTASLIESSYKMCECVCVCVCIINYS